MFHLYIYIYDIYIYMIYIYITYIYITYIYIDTYDITTSLRPTPGIMVNKGNDPQMAVFQASELLICTQI